MKNIIIMTDHSIGYEVVKYILSDKSTKFNFLQIYTNKSNNSGYWNSIDTLLLDNLFYYEDDEHFLNLLSSIKQNIDYIFLLSWRHIIPDSILKLPSIGTINLHYSLLPKYKGVYPVNTAIIKGEEKTGITYHWVDSTIDGGKIIVQKEIKIDLNDTADTLLQKLDLLALKEFKNILDGSTILGLGSKQDALKSYFSKADFKASNQLDLNKEYKAIDLLNLFRGKTFKDSKNLYFLDKFGKKIYLNIKLEVEK